MKTLYFDYSATPSTPRGAKMIPYLTDISATRRRARILRWEPKRVEEARVRCRACCADPKEIVFTPVPPNRTTSPSGAAIFMPHQGQAHHHRAHRTQGGTRHRA